MATHLLQGLGAVAEGGNALLQVHQQIPGEPPPPRQEAQAIINVVRTLVTMAELEIKRQKKLFQLDVDPRWDDDTSPMSH